MKTLFYNRLLLVIITSVVMSNVSYAQIGLHYETMKSNAGVGFDTSKGTSAKTQLENITGQKISTSTTKNQYYNQPQKSVVKTPTLSYNQQTQVMVAGMLFQALLGNLFATNQADAEAQKQAAAIAAQKAAEQKKAEEELAQAKHDKMLESYKTLEGSQGLELKTLGNTDLGFKTLDNNNSNQQVHKNIFGSNNSVLENQTWVETQKQLFNERIENPNKWANGIYNSLKTNAPPLPFKKFNELEPGDVLLIAPESDWKNNPKDYFTGNAIKKADQFATVSTESNASHTVTFLKEENGIKKFMDNEPEKGPVIIDEQQFLEKYGKRDMDVARLKIAQPLNERQTDQLYKEALKFQQENEKGIIEYGLTNGNMIVCSEASWALIKSTGVLLPGTDFSLKQTIGIKISPADFYKMKQAFLVTPLALDK